MAYATQYIRLVGFDNKPIDTYPVAVFDNNGKLLGYADNAGEVVTLWNGSAVNSSLGSIIATADNCIFLFRSPTNGRVFQVRATTFTEIDSAITLIGTSYFSNYHQTVPYLFDNIKDYFGKTLTGYTDGSDNNGKVSHDRLRKVHELINGTSYGESIFFYWCINDLLYQDASVAVDAYDKAQFKVKSSHYTALANCFSKSFNCFVDAVTKVNTTDFEDVNNTFAAKCGFLSKNILVLPDDTAYLEFTAKGKTNIVYFVSDGVGQTLGNFNIYVNGVLAESVECNGKTVDLTGLNPTIVTEGDSYCSPNSIVLKLPDVNCIVRIENTSSEPVWLDYYSELETDVNKGAKPVYACNVPSFVNGWVISGLWEVQNSTMEECNANLKEVYDFWREELGAPVAIGDTYTGFNPNTMYHADQLHVNQLGSDQQLKGFVDAVKAVHKNKIIV